LLTPSTETGIERIATQILATVTADAQIDATHRSEGTLDDIYITATHIVSVATQASEALARQPSLALTVYPTNVPEACTPALYNYSMNDLSGEMETALANAGLTNADVDGFSIGVLEGEHGCTTRYPLETRIEVSVSINPDSAEVIAQTTAAILDVLSGFPRQDTYGSQRARLTIYFYDGDNQIIGVIDTGYNNALYAYAEGLRGEDLLLALGELLPVIRPIVPP
jgi:hypothetical protein